MTETEIRAGAVLAVKTPEQRQAEQVKKYVDEYAALSLEAERIKGRMDSKLLSISYWGTRNSRVSVTNTAAVKPISLTMVKKVLGDVAGDFVKTETTDKMTEPCKRLLAMICQGSFAAGSLEETIQAITSEPKIQAILRKKLKGRYEKDRALLEKVAGLPEQEAGDWAFLTAEVINWEWLTQVLKAAGWKGTA